MYIQQYNIQLHAMNVVLLVPDARRVRVPDPGGAGPVPGGEHGWPRVQSARHQADRQQEVRHH